jgi:hypothetical protein
MLNRCHPNNREDIAELLKRALAHKGPTIFDDLVKIIRSQTNVDIELRLE